MQLFIILLTAALDFFHLGIVYPIFTEIVVDSAQGMSWGSQSWERAMSFTAFIIAFPIAQFIGAPIIGKISDIYGRKPILFISVAGSGIGMAICALGVMYGLPLLILFGRFGGGLMGANISLAYAALVDISTPQNKVKNLALIPLVTSAGFILGPLLVGVIGDSRDFPILGQSLPLWIAVFFTVINWSVLWKFEDQKPTLKESRAKKSLLTDPSIWRPLAVCFLMIAANFLLIQFVGAYSINILHADLRNISWIYVNLSLSCAIGHIFLTRTLAAWASPKTLLPWSLGALAVSLIAVGNASSLLVLHLSTFFAMICCAVAYTNSFAYLSEHASSNQQGEVMGLGVSAQCLAEWLPALCLGAFVVDFPAIPMICGAGACLIGVGIMVQTKFSKTVLETKT